MLAYVLPLLYQRLIQNPIAGVNHNLFPLGESLDNLRDNPVTAADFDVGFSCSTVDALK